MPRRKDMRKPDMANVGKRFGKLVVKEYAGNARWLCECDCGGWSSSTITNLKKGATTSCGCRKGKWTHGKSHLPEHNVWNMMIQRCCNPRYNRYLDYGGRGIKVCERWRGKDGFSNFLADMGQRPSSEHKLERNDNDAGYTPGNCSWKTQAQQSRNRRNNVWLEFNGERLVLQDWAKRLGIKVTTLAYRVKNWSLEQALTSPIQRKPKTSL